MSEEQISTFNSMVSKARQLKKKEEEEMRQRATEFDRITRLRVNRRMGPGRGAVGGMLQGVGAQLMEPQPQVHPDIDIGAA